MYSPFSLYLHFHLPRAFVQIKKITLTFISFRYLIDIHVRRFISKKEETIVPRLLRERTRLLWDFTNITMFSISLFPTVSENTVVPDGPVHNHKTEIFSVYSSHFPFIIDCSLCCIISREPAMLISDNSTQQFSHLVIRVILKT